MKRLVLVCAFLCAFVESRIAFAQTNQIHVGRNVQVSQAHADYSLGEVLLSADPADANRLLGCGVVYAESENRRWTVVYLSTDGGRTWQPTLETKGIDIEDSTDPACALGRNGLALHIAGNLEPKKSAAAILGVYRSTDGGATWNRQEDIIPAADNESVIIDTTQGKFNNRVYITGMSGVRNLSGASTSPSGFAVWHSRDGGVIFEGPLKRGAVLPRLLIQMGRLAVLSDGTVASVFGDIKNWRGTTVAQYSGQESDAVLESVAITDGGDTLSEASRVDDFFMSGKTRVSQTGVMPTVAVDPGGGPFRDRLYATWADVRDGRSAIRLAYSSDKGKTWSRSIVIDDVPGPAESTEGPQNSLPTVAVNKAGVVAVTWYDRRDNPDGLGWYLRVRASLDGGDTWLPSARVSEKPNTFSSSQRLFTLAYNTKDVWVNPNSGESPTHVGVILHSRQFFAGDYAGLAADASGTFHAFWIDNRTGLAQIWSAPIVVDGKAVRNGDVTLSELKDVTSDVDLKIVSTSYDRASNTVTLGVRLKNSSRKSIRGPVKLRLVNISSTIGSPSAANADNHFAQPGAIWDLSSFLKDNTLKLDETSPVKQLIFHVDNPRDVFYKMSLHYDLLQFDIRVLAGGAEPEVKTVTKKPGSAN